MRLHQAGYVHRDIKPSNALWMLQTQAWKLLDFGIACKAGAYLASTLPGKPSATQLNLSLSCCLLSLPGQALQGCALCLIWSVHY